jgi:hypothetical protein
MFNFHVYVQMKMQFSRVLLLHVNLSFRNTKMLTSLKCCECKEAQLKKEISSKTGNYDFSVNR